MHGVNMVALMGLVIAWWFAVAWFGLWVESRPARYGVEPTWCPPVPAPVELDVDLSDLVVEEPTLQSSRPAELARADQAAESLRRWRASIPEVVEPSICNDPTEIVDVRALRAG